MPVMLHHINHTIGISFLQSIYLYTCLIVDYLHKLECNVYESRDFCGFFSSHFPPLCLAKSEQSIYIINERMNKMSWKSSTLINMKVTISS